MKTHLLKIAPAPFVAVCEALKTFEYRKNDRDFMVGDNLHLVEHDPDFADNVAPASIVRRITYILHGPNYGIPVGYCVMSIVSADI